MKIIVAFFIWTLPLLPISFLYANENQLEYTSYNQYIVVLDINTQKTTLLERVLTLDSDLLNKINILQLSDSVYAAYSKPNSNKMQLDKLLKEFKTYFISAHIQTVDINEYNEAIIIHGSDIQKIEDTTEINIDFFSKYNLSELLFNDKIQTYYSEILCKDINYTQEPYETLQDVNKSLNTASLEDLIVVLKQNEKEHLDHLENNNFFKGFYLGGRFEQYLNEDYEFREDVDYEYRINARWEIFKNGYYAYEKIQKKKKNRAKTRYLRLLSHVMDRYHDDKSFDIQVLKYKAQYFYNVHLEKAYINLLQKREKQLRDGFTTIDDVYHVKERLENSRILKGLNSPSKMEESDNASFVFLQSLECAQLVEQKWLLEYEDENNIQLQLQNNLIDELEFSSEYTDELKVTLFTEHRNVDRIGWYNTAGIKVDIPLGWDNEKSNIQRLEKINFEIEKRAYNQSLEKHTLHIYTQFDYNQKLLKVLKNKLKYFQIRKKQLQKINNNSISGFKSDPNREIDTIVVKIINIKYEIILKRIQIYENILQLYRLSGVDNIKLLLKYKQERN